MPLKILVISLPDATRRRRDAVAQLAAHDVQFEFLDAMRGADALQQGIFSRVDETSFLLNTGRRMTPGEIGCFASHRLAWQRCVDRGVPMVIMEDDFQLRDHFPAALDACESVIDRLGFLRLQTTLRSKEVHIADLGDFELKRFTKPPHGLMCYCLSPPVAQRFIELTHVLDAPVDVFMKKYWEHGQALHALTPFSVEPSTHHSRTTISGRVKARKTGAIALKRLVRKLRGHVSRLRSNWLFRRYDGGRQIDRQGSVLSPLDPG